jgi:multicomponent K+:H+ antiporter subunit E
MMKRLLPLPLLSAALALAWITLTEVSAAHALIAVALGLAIPLAVWPLVSDLPRVRSPAAAVRLLGIVAVDIVLANIEVARLVLGPLERLTPRFLEVPLELRDPHTIALLASIITLTPGTVSVALTPERSALLVHALNADDSGDAVARIKSRYERRIMEVFAC